MNSAPDPHDHAQGPRGGAPPGEDPSPLGGFFPWLRGLDMVRSDSDRWFTGVAGGIAHKAGIDPLIVRGIFVVLAILGGPGIILYLAGWLLLPHTSGKIHLEELFRGRATPGVIIALIVSVVWFLSAVFGGGNLFAFRWNLWDVIGLPWWVNTSFTWLFWAAVLVGVGLLIHRIILWHGRDQQARTTGAGAADAGAADAAPAASAARGGHPTFAETVTDTTEAATEKINTWSAQYSEQYDKRRLGAGHAIITAALAFIAAGGAAFWVDYAGVTAGSGPWPATATITVAALVAATAVLSISMMIAGLRGRNSGGVGFFAFLGVLALAFSALFPSGTSVNLVGNTTVTTATPASLSIAGDTYLDLGLYDENSAQTQVEVTQLAGTVHLDLPEVRPVEVVVDVAAGRVEGYGLDGRHQSGVLNRRTILANEAGPGPTLHVHVRVLAGKIIITE